jgi:small subunit ribosomal protein S17
MSDDETKKDETTEPQDEPQQDAGPVADEDTSSSQAAGEAPSPAPPASDAAEADAPAADEGSSDDAPAAKEAAPAAEPDPEDDLPWKERRRLQRSRRPSKAKPALSTEDRAAARLAARKKKAAERRKERAAAKARKGAPGTGTPPAERDSNAAKVRQGIVVSNKGDKSITVRIDFARRHPTYEKIVRRSRTLHAHDESNAAGEGDVVRIVETRPLSKTKRWRLVDVVEKAR